MNPGILIPDELVTGLTSNWPPPALYPLPKNGSNQFYPAEYPKSDESFEPARLISAHALPEVFCAGNTLIAKPHHISELLHKSDRHSCSLKLCE